MSTSETKRYGVGVDTHSKFIQICVVDASGAESREWHETFRADSERLRAADWWVKRTPREAGVYADPCTTT